jgi:hypothetical protein
VSGTRLSDENTLAVPDRRGNNRIDSLRNLIIDPRVALLFLIPGVGRKDAGRDQRRQGRRGPARSHGTRENEGNDLLNSGKRVSDGLGSGRPRRQLRWPGAAEDSSPHRHIGKFQVRVHGANHETSTAHIAPAYELRREKKLLGKG